MTPKELALELHRQWAGKIEMVSRVPLNNEKDLAMAYTPGVAEPCLAIANDISQSYVYTRRHNTIAVITDGTAVLGLGDIGPEAGMPVMEGKAVLFKTFAGIDAIPLCIGTKDSEEIIKTIANISGSFGGINLEDIAAPRCFEIERRLQEMLDIPVFHDDQHGTAVVVAAALLNALKLTGRNLQTARIVINGAGAAGSGVALYLFELGAKDIVICDRNGIIQKDDPYMNETRQKLVDKSNIRGIKGTLKDAMADAQVFIGLSGPNCVTKDMVRSMAARPIVFPLANPVSEISYEEAQEAGAYIIGTGSSNYPNQVNNALVFPGIFKGALKARARNITFEMMRATSYSIASSIGADSLTQFHIIPSVLDKSVHDNVAEAVFQASEKRI